MVAEDEVALLDEDAWEAPERLTEDDCWAVTGSDALRERRDTEDGR